MNLSSRLLALAALLAPALAAPAATWKVTGNPAGPRAPRLVFASYLYSFQSDARRGEPRGVRLANGATALTHHPWESAGPWFSGDRPQWHVNQLQLMQGAGIDVALPLYDGDAAGRKGGALTGLAALVEGIKELEESPAASRSRSFPQIGIAIDLEALARQYGGAVDLKDADVQRSLYGMLREVALRLPAGIRATAQVPPSENPDPASAGASVPDGTAVIVRLTGGQAVRDADGSFLRACGERFAREFGARLVWIGTPEMRAKFPNLDGYAAANAAAGPARIEPGALATIASLGPGFENSIAADDGSARSRSNGSAYITDWRAALAAQPEWVFLDSWNDFARGTDLAPTLEYGLQYRDLTRGATMQFKSTPASLDFAGTIVTTTLPRQLQPGLLYPVDVVVKNDGNVDWTAFSQVAVSYRWLRSGEPVGDVAPAVALAQPRGEARRYTIGLTAPLKDGKPLPEGRYTVEIGLVRRNHEPSGRGEQWLPAEAALPYRAAVQVGAAPALRPYWLESSVPTAAAAGATYHVTVRLRNDGSEAWKPENGAALGFRWRRVSSYLKGFSEDRDEVVSEGAKIPLPETVVPGRAATVPAEIPLVDASGKPLPAWSPASPWDYLLEWDLWDGHQWATQAGIPGLREVVDVVDRDPAPSFIGCNLASEMVAGRTEKVTLGLRNLGPESWKAGRDRITVHWYYMDGTEAAWQDTSTPLPEDVPPFSEVAISAPAPGPAADRSEGRRTRVEGRVPSGRSRVEGRTDSIPDTRHSPPAPQPVVVVQQTIVRDVPVQVPHYFGPMYCVFDLVRDGQPASIAPGLKGTDILAVPVNVYSPEYLPLPLTPFFNVDGVSSDLNRADGDVDGYGNSLPAEQLPPYVTRPAVGTGPAASPIYPCGLWVRGLNQPGSDRVNFLYPSKADHALNMIACAGQQIPLVAGPRLAVHLLALATAEDAPGDFHLFYEDGSSESRPVTFTYFTDPPRHGEHAAIVTAHRHTRQGDDLQSRCYLNHYVLPADSRKPLAALQLPQNKAIKIMAITLQSPSFGSSAAGR